MVVELRVGLLDQDLQCTDSFELVGMGEAIGEEAFAVACSEDDEFDVVVAEPPSALPQELLKRREAAAVEEWVVEEGEVSFDGIGCLRDDSTLADGFEGGQRCRGDVEGGAFDQLPPLLILMVLCLAHPVPFILMNLTRLNASSGALVSLTICMHSWRNIVSFCMR